MFVGNQIEGLGGSLRLFHVWLWLCIERYRDPREICCLLFRQWQQWLQQLKIFVAAFAAAVGLGLSLTDQYRIRCVFVLFHG